MADTSEPAGASDPHNLNRFVQAQEDDYEQALGEIRNGRKQSHWIWYIFPQFDGLGSSSMCRRYSVKSVAEAGAYLNHPVLGPRLVECVEAALRVEGRSAFEIFRSPDDMKLRSCATLFACVSPAESVFDRLLDKYFEGKRDGTTIRLLGIAPEDKWASGRPGTVRSAGSKRLRQSSRSPTKQPNSPRNCLLMSAATC